MNITNNQLKYLIQEVNNCESAIARIKASYSSYHSNYSLVRVDDGLEKIRQYLGKVTGMLQSINMTDDYSAIKEQVAEIATVISTLQKSHNILTEKQIDAIPGEQKQLKNEETK